MEALLEREKVHRYYFNARWYDPETGRFITEDPVKDGLLWYAYVNNNPMGFVDPTGMIGENPTGQYIKKKLSSLVNALKSSFSRERVPSKEAEISPSLPEKIEQETPSILPASNPTKEPDSHEKQESVETPDWDQRQLEEAIEATDWTLCAVTDISLMYKEHGLSFEDAVEILKGAFRKGYVAKETGNITSIFGLSQMFADHLDMDKYYDISSRGNSSQFNSSGAPFALKSISPESIPNKEHNLLLRQGQPPYDPHPGENGIFESWAAFGNIEEKQTEFFTLHKNYHKDDFDLP